MPQIIYTENLVGENGKPINTTPAGSYAVSDMETILTCIERGELVCGTGQIYPVDWNEDDDLPWKNDTFNPWKNLNK